MWIWDPEKNRINQRKHGISFETARLVFYDLLSVTKPKDFYLEELRFNTIGMVGGIVLIVAHTQPEYRAEHGAEIGRIISARKATSHERRNYEEGVL